MSYEVSPPARNEIDRLTRFPEGYPQPGLFGVDLMNDHQIAMTGRALDIEKDRMIYESARTTAGTESQVLRNQIDETGALLEHLGSDLAQLAMRNPERGGSLLKELASNDDLHIRNTAAAAAIPLGLGGGYELAFDTLATAYERDESRRETREGMSDARFLDLLRGLRAQAPSVATILERRWYERFPDALST